jgi:serine/threonine protein kinase
LSKADKLHELIEVLERLPDSERVEFVNGIRSDDSSLADRLESLIAERSPTDATDPTNSRDELIGFEQGSSEVSMTDVVDRLAKTRPEESRYELRGEIARGGMGAIIKVWDKTLRRNLAMKVALGKEDPDKPGSTSAIDERTLGRFLDEAQVTGQLDHPGIVPVYELGVDDGDQVYFTMRMVKGRTLSEIFDLVKRGEEGWTQTRALGVILKVCEAMAYAHSKNVIHRDLKPANIMVGRFGEVYVMDWGLARVIGKDDSRDIRVRPDATASIRSARRDVSNETPDSPLLTMDGDVVGTPAYMSPEQATGQIAAMGAHSDVYAVGAILYQLLAGHMPYVPPGAVLNNYAVWSRVQEGSPKSIQESAPEASVEISAICEKAMARETGQRYGDMTELAEDLSAYFEGRVVKAYETGTWAEGRKWVRRNRALSTSAAAAIIIALAGFARVSCVQSQGRLKAEQERSIAEKHETRARHLASLARAANPRLGDPPFVDTQNALNAVSALLRTGNRDDGLVEAAFSFLMGTEVTPPPVAQFLSKPANWEMTFDYTGGIGPSTLAVDGVKITVDGSPLRIHAEPWVAVDGMRIPFDGSRRNNSSSFTAIRYDGSSDYRFGLTASRGFPLSFPLKGLEPGYHSLLAEVDVRLFLDEPFPIPSTISPEGRHGAILQGDDRHAKYAPVWQQTLVFGPYEFDVFEKPQVAVVTSEEVIENARRVLGLRGIDLQIVESNEVVQAQLFAVFELRAGSFQLVATNGVLTVLPAEGSEGLTVPFYSWIKEPRPLFPQLSIGGSDWTTNSMSGPSTMEPDASYYCYVSSPRINLDSDTADLFPDTDAMELSVRIQSGANHLDSFGRNHLGNGVVWEGEFTEVIPVRIRRVAQFERGSPP